MKKDNIDYIAIGKRIKTARKSKKFTQEKLATICELSIQHISNIENGNSKLSLPTLIDIANALNVTVDFLLTDVTYNNREIMMKEVYDFFESCDQSETYFYLDILKKIKELYNKK